MNKPIVTLIATACITLSSATIAFAKPHHSDDFSKRTLSQLDLSAQQKQDIKAVLKATREDNSVFAGERQEMRAQMQALMNMPVWDAATAESIIRAQITQGQSIALNRAKARNQVYNLLSDEQQTQLNEKASSQDSRKGKFKRDNDEKSRMKDIDRADVKQDDWEKKTSRISKKLELTDAQEAQWKSIHKEAKKNAQAFRVNSKSHRETMKTIVQQAEFDEQAWLTAQASFKDELVAHRVAQAKVRYDSMSILTDEQREKMQKMSKRMKEKRGHRESSNSDS